MPALIAFSCFRLTMNRSTMADMCAVVAATPFPISSSTALPAFDGGRSETSTTSGAIWAEMSTSLPSMIIRRQPFLRTSVRTKSSSSP